MEKSLTHRWQESRLQVQYPHFCFSEKAKKKKLGEGGCRCYHRPDKMMPWGCVIKIKKNTHCNARVGHRSALTSLAAHCVLESIAMIEKSILPSAGVEGMKIICTSLLIARGDKHEWWVHPSDKPSSALARTKAHTVCCSAGFIMFDMTGPCLPLQHFQAVTTTGHNKPNEDPSGERLQRDAAVPAHIFE